MKVYWVMGEMEMGDEDVGGIGVRSLCFCK